MSITDIAGKRVLVTGGLGFIGSNLAHRLVGLGCDVLLVDSLVPEYGGSLFNVAAIRDRVAVNISDVRDEHSLSALVRDRDFIFNLAGQTSHLDSMADPETDLEINARAQLKILEACRRENSTVRIVFASTRQIYGRPRYLPVDEEHPLQPVDVSGVNKLAGEWYHLLYGEVHGLHVSILRLTNTFGPRMRVRDARQTFLGVWLRAAVEQGEILVFGDGQQKRDFTYVDDAVEALLLAATDDRARGRVFNVGGTEPVALADLARRLTAAAGGGVSWRLIPFPEDRKAIDIGDYFSDDARIRDELGWRPRTDLDTGLLQSLAYYREYGHEYWQGDG